MTSGSRAARQRRQAQGMPRARAAGTAPGSITTSPVRGRVGRRWSRVAREVVAVVVMVLVDGEGAGLLGTEQARVLGMLSHGFRHARAADVAVQADDAVALGHDDVQVVRDQQHAEAAGVAQATDERVELRLRRRNRRRGRARRAPGGRGRSEGARASTTRCSSPPDRSPSCWLATRRADLGCAHW